MEVRRKTEVYTAAISSYKAIKTALKRQSNMKNFGGPRHVI